jgi:hypothetical protein
MHDSTPSSDWKARLMRLRNPDFWHKVDAWLRSWGPLLVLVFAVCYYSQYYRSGLNLGGEGGTDAVIAMRLNAGWLPIKDTVLNYNVMWFYPVAWLFKLTGPNYIVLRLFFFVLCTISGLLVFSIIRRVSGRGWYAIALAVLVVAIPGMMFRNYMGLLPVLNIWALLHAFIFESRDATRRWLWFLAAGLVLGTTFLVRIDIGLFFAVIYFGLLILYPLGVPGRFISRALTAIGGGAVCFLAAFALHLPFYFDAVHRGFGPEFVGQYSRIWNYMVYEARKDLAPSQAMLLREPRTVAANRTAPMSLGEGRSTKSAESLVRRAAATPQDGRKDLRSGRPRDGLGALFEPASSYDAIFILALYLPLLVTAIVIPVGGAALLWAIVRGDSALKESALVCLVTLGSALTLFSQYFFFRPDTPHLSEFMVPFVVAMGCSAFYAVRWACRTKSLPARIGCIAFAVLCLVSEGLYFCHAFPKDSAGTIAARRKRNHEFIAENGVHVFVKKGDLRKFQAIQKVIMACSTTSDWVITYPYSPTINFMTNRPSYLRDLYIDNATASRNFTEETRRQIEHYRPAVIVIDERPINKIEVSRFKNWAAPAYDYIRSHYVLAVKADTNEVYVRPDKIPPRT